MEGQEGSSKPVWLDNYEQIFTEKSEISVWRGLWRWVFEWMISCIRYWGNLKIKYKAVWYAAMRIWIIVKHDTK